MGVEYISEYTRVFFCAGRDVPKVATTVGSRLKLENEETIL